MKKGFIRILGCFLASTMLLTGVIGCSKQENTAPDTKDDIQTNTTEVVENNVTATPEPTKTPVADTNEGDKKMDYADLFKNIKKPKLYKELAYTNPLISQDYGADPFAMVYKDTVYVYMTQDRYETEADGTIKTNGYGTIRTIRVISSTDMVNWTDHGEIKVANGNVGAAWARNSWAPAAAWKNIDGQDKFFLYFADSGNGIGVMVADSPVGPFTDPLGKGLIRRDMPNCGNVEWLFDPAVFVDDDGRAYLYFGGGVPSGKAAHPSTARCVELGDDMISIKGEPVVIDAPYLFEDSGIHKFNGKYYYTYSSNFSVDKEGTAEYGMVNGEICMMESDSPLGPFTYKEVILENPGVRWKIGGNNHHCVFNFKGQWYIAYHNSYLGSQMGVEKGYRSTFINKVTIHEDGSIGKILQSLKGGDLVSNISAYSEINACTFSHQAGLEVAPGTEVSNKYGSGEMKLTGIQTGDYFRVRGLDFAYNDANKITMTIRKTKELEDNCCIELRIDGTKGDLIGYVPVAELMKDKTTDGKYDYVTITAELLTTVNDIHDVFMLFSGEGYEILNYKFEGQDKSWYDVAVEESFISAGTNGRMERALAKLAAGETVSIAFIGGSVTEGAGAANLSESYADRTISLLKKEYPNATINYVDAGLGGTPSSLGIMRYKRDVVDVLGTEPDILFIEFSVNDYEECTKGKAFESLIKTALTDNDKTAVALVFAVFKNKWNMQDNYIPLGKAYGLPMVSIKNGTKKAFDNGFITNEKFFSDDYHPTSYGHAVMADMIMNMLKECGELTDTVVSEIPEKATLGTDYYGTELITSADSKDAVISAGGFTDKDTLVHSFMRTGKSAFGDNWKHVKNGDATEFVMELECKTLLINYKQSSSADAGTAIVYVDGVQVQKLNSYASGGWNQSIVELLIEEKEAKRHVIKIVLEDASKDFTILSFGYTK